jgi:peroxin-5
VVLIRLPSESFLKTYAEPQNKFVESPPSPTLLSDAKAMLDNNGSLSEAALLLEAAIQKGDLGKGGYEAWILLGETRSMDEREEAGMLALMQGVKLAEAAGDAGEGMMVRHDMLHKSLIITKHMLQSLAISFTNESYERASHSTLLRWLRARYPSHPVPEETINSMFTGASWDTHDKISEVFINLARSQHAQNTVDPDVQIGLGVLFYANSDFDRAKDCFESALAMRPDDYLLWNRLGSCLSNGSKPEEALGAYREALQRRPTYTRAIYNVGVACECFHT